MTSRMSVCAFVIVIPCRAHLLGQLRLGQLDRVLHVDRREVLVPREVEVDLQVHRPVAGVGRLVVEQAVEPGELLLDRRGHRLARRLPPWRPG